MLTGGVLVQMAKGEILPVCLGVKRLGRMHMFVALGDQQGLAHVERDVTLDLEPGVITDMGEIVIGIDIL